MADEWRKELELALTIAKNATNGWACYARRQNEHDEIARLHNAISESERRLSSLPPVRAQEPTDRIDELAMWVLDGKKLPDTTVVSVGYWTDDPLALLGTRFNAVVRTTLGELRKQFAAALPPVQATTAEEKQMDVQSPGEARYEQIGDPDRCAGCGEPTDDKSGICCICAELGPPTKAEPKATGYQYGTCRGTGNPHYCPNCDRTIFEAKTDTDSLQKSSPLRETPAPDLARVRALEEACRVALDVFRNAGQLTGHSGDEESGQHDEDCFACHAEAALAQISAALEGASPQETK